MQDKNQHALFPVEMHGNWSVSHVHIPEEIKHWLYDANSLTARLKQHCQKFRVEVLGQKIELCALHEVTPDICAHQEVLVREVLLFCDDKPQVFARSLLPLSSLTGNEKQLATLGNQSLGQVLFNHPNLQRKCIEVSCFDESSPIIKLVKHLNLPMDTEMWGRRSTFFLDDKPLIVAEVFLPDAFAYLPENIV